jgi:hypothetical protein
MSNLFLKARFTRLRKSGGSQIAEAAVVLPVLFLLLFSIYWFGRAFSIYGTINHAAREGARTAAVPVCANCGADCTGTGSTMPCDKTVVDTVNNALTTARVDPTQATPFTPAPAPQTCPGAVPQGICAIASGTAPSAEITICRNVWLNQGSKSPAVCGVIISFEYPYQLAFPFSSLGHQKIFLKAQVEMQGED